MKTNSRMEKCSNLSVISIGRYKKNQKQLRNNKVGDRAKAITPNKS